MNKLKIVNTQQVKNSNQKSLLRVLRVNGEMSGADLARELNVPAGTVARLITSLGKAGLIKSGKSRKEKGVGKPPVMHTINKKYATVIGIELNELNMRLILTDFSGNIIGRSLVTYESIQENLIAEIDELALKMIEESGISSTSLTGVGVGLSGIYSAKTDKVIQGFLPSGLELRKMIMEKLHVPVYIGNDANLVTLAEKKFGVAQQYENLICMHDRGWVGAGLILGNELYVGSNQAAGEIGAGIHSPEKRLNLNLSEFPIIESYGLERRLRELNNPLWNPALFESREKLIELLVEKAESGDKESLDIIDCEADSFAEGLHRLSHLFDPDALLITGDIAAGGKMLEDKIRALLLKKSPEEWTLPVPEFTFGALQQDGVALGAASVMIEEVENKAVENS